LSITNSRSTFSQPWPAPPPKSGAPPTSSLGAPVLDASASSDAPPSAVVASPPVVGPPPVVGVAVVMPVLALAAHDGSSSAKQPGATASQSAPPVRERECPDIFTGPLYGPPGAPRRRYRERSLTARG